MTDCLRNAVVVRIILQHFSNYELIKLSFVNKLWNYEARSVMKNRGDILAHLTFHDNQPCQEYLEAFAADLSQMNIVPFSEILIEVGHSSRCCQIPVLDSIYHSILDQLPLKSVSLVMEEDGEWCKNKDCPGSLLVTKILKNFSGVLEQVSLANTVCEDDELNVVLRDCKFPRLKILKLGESYDGLGGSYLTSKIKALLAGAPKLQQLHTQGPMNLMLNALKGTTVVYVHQSEVAAPFDEIPDDAINAMTMRLEKIQLHYTGPNFNMERFNRITPMVLRACCTETLEAIDLDAVLAVPFMCYGIRFENVDRLYMFIQPDQIKLHDPRILRILKDFDFTRIFPNLEGVGINAHFDFLELLPDHMNEFIGLANASLKEHQPDRAINIKDLYIEGTSWSDAEFFAQMFPHTEALRVREETGMVSFPSIWKHWFNLMNLDVIFGEESQYEDLDSVICGIFPEEVDELRQKDEEFLKNVNIVPVMPSVTCFRNLRLLCISLETPSHDTLECRGIPCLGHAKPSPYWKFSVVTRLVAFARCPNLRVVLECRNSHVYEALKHMEPYATVKNSADVRQVFNVNGWQPLQLSVNNF